MTKKQREEVYNKYGGHCAYCGKKIEYKDMQVDHQIPQIRAKSRWHKVNPEKIYTDENLFPSCRRCNGYKRSNSLATFREWIEKIPEKLKNVFIYKVGLDYGIVEEYPKKIKFFFEKWEENSKVAMKPIIKHSGTDSEGYEYEDEYHCPTCGNLVGYKNYSSSTKLMNSCNECGRLIDWN